MVYPLLPLFLTRVLGAGAMSLGVDRRRRRSGQQRPQDHLGLARRPSGHAEEARARRLRPVVGRPSADRARVARGRRCSRSGSPIGSARASAARRATRCSPTSRRRTRAAACTASTARWITPAPCRPAARVRVPVLLSRRVPHALRADDRPGHHRHRPASCACRVRNARADRRPGASQRPALQPATSAHACRRRSTRAHWPSSSSSRSATRATRSSCCA